MDVLIVGLVDALYIHTNYYLDSFVLIGLLPSC